MLDVVVVGAGPNGLTAAARLARAGLSVAVFEAAATVGGGARTKPLANGAVYDVCSAVHPLGATSPAFEGLDLGAHGLRWVHPPLAVAHPFDDGEAAVLHRDLDATCAGLGSDGDRWRRAVGGIVADWPELRDVVFGPIPQSLARHPLVMARFGVRAGLPASLASRWFRGRDARGLFGGLAAHSTSSLGVPMTTAIALVLVASAHSAGMPFAAGGSQSIVDALAAAATAHGATIECDRRITSIEQLPQARAVVMDLTPGQVASLTGRVPPRWRHGEGAWKLDLLLSARLPWTAAACCAAGTVHLGGDFAKVAAAERTTARGGLPDRPYVLVAQPSVADPSRSPEGQHVVWAYRHVPNGCTDQRATDGIHNQLDRFAPGWRDLLIHAQVTTPAMFQAYNECYIGGDIAGGAITPWQLLARPRLTRDPYRTQTDGVWICSQSTPPGPGVHGMCGWQAAASVLTALAR